jgi:hypothetical protein
VNLDELAVLDDRHPPTGTGGGAFHCNQDVTALERNPSPR